MSESEKQFYAHSLPGKPESEWQRLDMHLRAVAALASGFAQKFGSSDWAWNAGMLHDLGKAADEFRAYLLRENHIDDEEYDGTGGHRVNHSSAGTALAEEVHNQHNRPLGRILSYLVAGHHAGLPDYHTCDGGMGALQKRLEEGKVDFERIRTVATGLKPEHRPLSQLPVFVKKENFHFWVRILFSCLVDADFLDTEAFIEPEQARYRVKSRSLAELKTPLDRYMADMTTRCEHTPVNRVRQEILTACLKAASRPSGLFTLTVPTGGGKTLSAMAFALDHAIRHGKHRVIYVIPHTSIIEQTAATLAEIFGPENVVEHHSNLDPEKETLRTRLEAGVDIDFPVVYRALAGLDSIAQAAGRCNREGKLAYQGQVMVFVPPKSVPRGLLHKGECTTRELHALPGFDAQAPESFTRYFDLFYSKVNDTGEGFLKRLTPSDPRILDIAFRSVGDQFRLIDDQAQRPVLVHYRKGEALIGELQRTGPYRSLMRRLQRYTVNLPVRLADRMLSDGLLEEVWPGFLAQCPVSIYSESIGLDVFRDGFPIEDLTCV
ncbi:CRISPR-associated endonuclease Cas3'' [Anaerobaca lacustris]|uniref:CRISPR-associated endonuclease Cas3 n=1 Tax=Anaerobaca lacustris TaxID=3044600 RepID=A0AAW6TV02_9BACT|nr:CRISPR-associated endonuclease Cas3'' [Sedimentisphaerales bacterium M17dextr]